MAFVSLNARSVMSSGATGAMDWNCVAMLIRASRMSPNANQRFPSRDRAMSEPYIT